MTSDEAAAEMTVEERVNHLVQQVNDYPPLGNAAWNEAYKAEILKHFSAAILAEREATMLSIAIAALRRARA